MFTGYLATLNTAALMPEALMASVFLPDLYTTLPAERTETALHADFADDADILGCVWENQLSSTISSKFLLIVSVAPL